MNSRLLLAALTAVLFGAAACEAAGPRSVQFLTELVPFDQSDPSGLIDVSVTQRILDISGDIAATCGEDRFEHTYQQTSNEVSLTVTVTSPGEGQTCTEPEGDVRYRFRLLPVQPGQLRVIVEHQGDPERDDGVVEETQVPVQ